MPEMHNSHLHPQGATTGDVPPAYDEIMLNPDSPDFRKPDDVRPPWWNARYWRKRVWGGLVVAIVLCLIIIVVVAVTQVRKNRYPDYTTLSYSLSDTYEGEKFFDEFNYFTGYDPTEGFVHYVPKEQSSQLNLTYASESSAVLRVDTSVGPKDEPNASTGRFSVRIESKKTYDNGLFIFDVKHTPVGCGTWPALWLTDHYNWPKHGEVDIMESTNQATDGNQMTLHTTDGCSMDVRRKQVGDAQRTTCDHSKNQNAGCGVKAEPDSLGGSFNKVGGGVMAVEWRGEGIRMWQFGRGDIPSDIKGKKPDPSTWGTALADFPSTSCDIGSHFRNNSIVVNIDLCGTLVYSMWDDSGCPSNCTDYVANNPDAFKDAFWEFGAFNVYHAK